MNTIPYVDIVRIDEMMARRGWGPGELATHAGVSYDTIYKIRNSQRPRTSVEILGRLATALGCSLDYLAHLTDDPTPASERELSADMRQLQVLFEALVPPRRRELLIIAEALLTAQHDTPEDQAYNRLMAFLLDKVEAVGGEDELNDLLAELEAALPGARRPFLHRRAQQPQQPPHD